MADLSLELLGGFKVRRASERATTFRTRKAKGLLAYLAQPPGQVHTRNKLAAVFWENSDQNHARRNLRNTLALLRKALSDRAARIVVGEGEGLYLDPEAVEVDVVAFDGLVARGTPGALEQAMRIYQGEFLDGFELREEAFVEWIDYERARLREKALAALARLLEHYRAAGSVELGIQAALRLLDYDPLQEPIHSTLIDLYLQQGRHGAALRQYETCRDVLERELGIEPAPEIERLHQKILSRRRPPVPDSRDDDALVTAASANADSVVRPYRTGRPAIAVLPFEYLGDQSRQNYLGTAITYDLVSALLRHRWFSVISATNMLDKGRYSMIVDGDVVESNVDYVVTGAIRTAGKRLRISVQLVETDSGEHIWSETYNRHFDNIFELQEEITGTIAGHIEPEIGARERYHAMRRPTNMLGAWDCFHLGMSHFYKVTSQDNSKALRLFERSLEFDPDFGEAHAFWSHAKGLSTFYYDEDPSEAILDQSLAAAQRAIEIDDHNAIFHMVLSRVYLTLQEYEKALVETNISVNLNPNAAPVYCGLGDALTYKARYDESLMQFEKALQLGPRDPYRWAYLGYGAVAHLFAGELETALDWAEQAIHHPNCQYWAYAHRVAALGLLGRQKEVPAAVCDLLRKQPKFSHRLAQRKMYFIKRPEQLRLYLDGLRKAGVPE